MNKLIERLSRYSKQCLTERLDADFANAIYDAIETIELQHKLIMLLIDVLKETEK